MGGKSQGNGLAKQLANSVGLRGSRDAFAKQLVHSSTVQAINQPNTTAGLNAANLRNLSVAAAAVPVKQFP